MKSLFTILCSIAILTNCSHCVEIDLTDLKFNEQDYSFFKSFNAGDTIIYASSNNIDTIAINFVDLKDKDLVDKDCGWIQRRPSNSMSVYIEHISHNKSPGNSADNDSDAKVKNNQWHFVLTKYLRPTERSFNLYYKDFSFYTDDIESFKSKNDTLINGILYPSYYTFHTSYPERVKDTVNITTIYWCKSDGIIAYKNLGGETYNKQKR